MAEQSILDEAKSLVHGDRGDAYGHPAIDFGRTGRMWGAILGLPDVPPQTVALCMIAVKLSREVNAHRRDSLVDIAGYAEAAQMVHDRAASLVPDSVLDLFISELRKGREHDSCANGCCTLTRP